MSLILFYSNLNPEDRWYYVDAKTNIGILDFPLRKDIIETLFLHMDDPRIYMHGAA